MIFKQQLGFFLRSFFLQVGWNCKKYQHFGFLFIMLPFLKHLYKSRQDVFPRVVKRYLDSFNTQPMMASFCIGALAKEEQLLKRKINKELKAKKEKLQEWALIKQSLTTTTASIGDRLFWGVLMPFSLLIAITIWLGFGINLFMEQNFSIPLGKLVVPFLVALFIFNVFAILIRWKGIAISYHATMAQCFGLTKLDWNKLIGSLKGIGFVLSIGVVGYGFYACLKSCFVYDLSFTGRGILILFFIGMSFLTKQLKIANLYFYLVTVFVFSILCCLN